MARKFTESADGVERTTVLISVRLSKDEIEEIKRLARSENTTWRGWLESHAALGIESGLIDEDGSMEQRYGRGGD